MKKEGKRETHILLNSNKGLSAIVATLIIILLVIVAAGIVWVVIKNIISQGAEGIELGKFTFDLSIKSAYIDGTNVKVVVRRSPGGGDLVGVRFIFFDGTNSISADRKIPLLELQEKLFSFNSSEAGDIDSLQEVSVAPIYKLDSGKEKIGDITDTATISGSGPGNGNGGNGGGAVCGNGQCEAPGETSMSCPADCTSGGGAVCGDGTCDATENSFQCPADCTVPLSCDGVWNQTDIDDGNECDGTPLPNGCSASCVCEAGFSQDFAGGCTLNPAINSGTIYSVWPTGAIKYFDSEDLPVDVSGYTMYYVNFSNSAENGCFRITWAEYLETNGRSYLRTEFIVNINAAETYHVWEAENCGA